MKNVRLDESQVGIKMARRNINNLRYADDTTLMAESEEELKSLLKKVKEESEKVGLKLDIQKTKIMASGPITSWEIDGETVETVFIFGGSKITADGDCSHESKRRLLLGRKIMTNLDSILKKQKYYFANKGPSSQGYGFSSGHVWIVHPTRPPVGIELLLPHALPSTRWCQCSGFRPFCVECGSISLL